MIAAMAHSDAKRESPCFYAVSAGLTEAIAGSGIGCAVLVRTDDFDARGAWRNAWVAERRQVAIRNLTKQA